MTYSFAYIRGVDTLLIGLTYDDLDQLREQPEELFMTIEGLTSGSPFDIMLVSTEEDIKHRMFGPPERPPFDVWLRRRSRQLWHRWRRRR